MTWPTDLTRLQKRISTPAEEVFKGLEVLGDHNEDLGDIREAAIKEYIRLLTQSALAPYHVNPGIGESGDGKTWAGAFQTMAEALTTVAEGGTILLTGSLTEDITTMDNYDTGKKDITIRGVGARRRPMWLGANTAPLIALNCSGWTFENIRFNVADDYDGLYLRMEAPEGGAYSTTINNCEFQGFSTTKDAIHFEDAPNHVKITNCWFYNIGGAGIGGAVGYGFAGPSAVIANNLFVECVKQISLWGIEDSLFLNNYFQGTGHVKATTHHLYFGFPAATSHNIIFGNFFGGTYSIAGGYQFHANDSFVGNWADDLESAGVNAAGNVIAVPA